MWWLGLLGPPVIPPELLSPSLLSSRHDVGILDWHCLADDDTDVARIRLGATKAVGLRAACLIYNEAISSNLSSTYYFSIDVHASDDTFDPRVKDEGRERREVHT
jgi:hypothetical protein